MVYSIGMKRTPELEIVRLRDIIISLEAKNNRLQRKLQEIDKLQNRIADMELANLELTCESAYTKELLAEKDLQLDLLLAGRPCDNICR